MYYVTMTDKFITAHGNIRGKIAKFIVKCKNITQAKKIKAIAKKREYSHIKIVTKTPDYDERKYQVRFIDYGSLIRVDRNWRK